MRTALRTALVVLVTVLLAGCGGGGSPSASTSSVPAASSADQQTAVQALTSIFVTDSTGSFGLTQDQAKCVAQGFVDRFGVQGLVDMGLLTSGLAPATTGPTPKLTADQASTAADAMLSCIKAGDFIDSLMAGSGMSQSVVDCLNAQLGDQGVHDVLVAVFENDQNKLQSAILPVMTSCALTQATPTQ